MFDTVYLEDDSSRRIGGPLWLFAFGLGFALVEMAIGGFTILNLLASDAWPRLTTPGTDVYHPLWSRAIGWELLTILILFPYALALLVCLVQRRRPFPRLSIVWSILGLTFAVVDQALISRIPDAVADGAYATVTVRMVLFAACSVIWAPYILFSERAKRTFVY
jgi:hypothetical protein